MRSKRFQGLVGLALIASLLNPLPWFNNVMLIGSTIVNADDLPPGETPPGEDEELPDAEQLALIKKISGYLSEIEASLADGDKDTADYLFTESDAMGGYATSIAAVSNVKNSAERAKLQARIEAIRAQLSGTVQPPSPVITTEEVTETKEEPYVTIRVKDPNLEEGKEEVATPGKAGVRTIVYTVTKTDGVETGRVVKSDEVTTPVINEVIRVGTKKTVVSVITLEEETETKAVPYETVRENDPTLEEGKEVVSVAGKAGVRTIVYTVTKTDGVETSRVVKSDSITTPAVNEVIKVGTKKVPGITTEEVTETKVVPYETVRENDPTLEEGKEVVSVAGKAGVRTIVYTVTKTDGVETSRVVKSDSITTPAVNEVIKVGTKKVPGITTEEVTETKVVPYETVRENDPTLEEGKEVVSVAGKAGVRTIVYTVTKTDGVETSRVVKSDSVTTPAVNEVIKVGTKKAVVPVITTEEVTETKAVPYETIRENDPTLEEGKEVVSVAGKAGVRTIVYTVTKTDGVETSRVVKSDSVTTPAVNEVIKVGTKKAAVPVITTEEVTETKAVPYETVRENDPTLEEGKEVVSVAGKAGVRTIVYTVTKTDGVETSRVVKSDSVTTPAVNEVIKVGTKKVPGITTEEVTETEAVPYETVRENDPTLEEGKEVVSVAGKAGVRTIVYTVTKTDGVETSRVVKSDSITTPAVNEVIKVGTKKAPVITTEEVTETEAIPYETVRENDPTLEEGKEVVSVAGKAGVRTIVYTVTKTDGVETGREVKSDVVTTPAVNEVIKVGTKKAPVITTEEVTETEAVAYETVREADPTLEEGKEVVSVAGEAGIRTIVYTVTKTDGVETGREVKSDVVTTPAVNEVIKVGTKKAPVITTEEVTETEAVAYETVRENDPTLEEGKEVVSVAGKAGVRTIVYTVTKTDGVETGREVKSDTITTPAVNEVIKVGTKKAPVITTEEVTETEAVAYETVRENDPTLEEGKEVVSVAGKAGVRTIVYTVTKTDGVETGREVKSDVVTTPAVNEVIKVGTKKVAPSIKNDVQKNEETVTKPQTSQNDKNKTVLPETGERVSTSIWMTFVGFVMMGVAFIKKRKQQ
ncbi:G5 domain-containing protein [Streptococcus suis]|uniref:G5 domain-containing protein n=2 Tax=Streptococcus suis TaxID=1307 RepID=UPI003D367F0C